MQAVEEDDATAADSTLARRARLREERTDNLAYDPEQQALRAALVRELHAAAVDTPGDATGVRVKHSVSSPSGRPVRPCPPPSPSVFSL